LNKNGYCIKIEGIVQGVGFRPFIYKEATALNLTGFVQNTPDGVYIEVTCDERTLERFIENISTKLPKISKITNLFYEQIEYKVFSSFEIVHSKLQSSKKVLVQSDIALCDDCQRELEQSGNRRENYFLINCTNCGPRYSIIKQLPYDRANTSMAVYTMCSSCEEEFNDVTNRRFHAQPICCEECGPKLSVDVDTIVSAIREGKIVALKGLGGFHLVGDASNETAVANLREQKNRVSKPLALMYPSIEMIKEHHSLSDAEEELLVSHIKPIVLIKTKYSMNKLIAPNIDRVGLFLPYTPLHFMILKKLNAPIVATSANVSDEPIIRSSTELMSRLRGVADMVVDFDREIVNSIDDSVMQIVAGKKITLRLARGLTPRSFTLKKRLDKKILAVGANQKSSIALAFDNVAILSGHIGDLNSIEAFEYFERTLKTFQRFYDFEPDLIVCDKHPEYETTKWAKRQNCELVQVQHHYAHTLACMFEHGIEDEVLAFNFDGTGYGDDKTIWGGEVFLASTKGYKRIFHLKPFRLLGAHKAIKEPRRVALALLFETFTLDEVLNLELGAVQSFSQAEIRTLHTVWKNSLNSPVTSSMGRLFDAVASFADISHFSSYDGESALIAERFYDETIDQKFSYAFNEDIIDLSAMIKEILLCDAKEIIISKFMNSIVDIICNISERYPEKKVVVSGGVFQNRTLLELLEKSVISDRLFYQQETPLNDGGIALGQLYSIISHD